MKCPSCKDVKLLMSEKKWVEIDYCPDCRGIWLDKGELEKLIEADKKNYDAIEKEYQEYDSDYQKGNKNKRHKKKESIFSEITDLFDF